MDSITDNSMTQEEKELLLKDLCARLSYGVMCYGVTMDMDEDDNYISKGVTGTLCEIHKYESKCCYGLVGLMNECNIETIKPYLRPMSSMTTEELMHYHDLCARSDVAHYEFSELGTEIEYNDTWESIDYLNSIHVDYRGLIPMGLAIEVTKENNPYKD